MKEKIAATVPQKWKGKIEEKRLNSLWTSRFMSIWPVNAEKIKKAAQKRPKSMDMMKKTMKIMFRFLRVMFLEYPKAKYL